MNALEDFSEKSRKDRDFAYMLLFVVAALVAFILYAKATYRDEPIGMNPTSELPESGCFGNDNRCGA